MNDPCLTGLVSAIGSSLAGLITSVAGLLLSLAAWRRAGRVGDRVGALEEKERKNGG